MTSVYMEHANKFTVLHPLLFSQPPQLKSRKSPARLLQTLLQQCRRISQTLIIMFINVSAIQSTPDNTVTHQSEAAVRDATIT